MANYDGPTYTLVPGTFREEGWEVSNMYAPIWSVPPVYSETNLLSGGGGGGPAVDQEINGYGYSHSG